MTCFRLLFALGACLGSVAAAQPVDVVLNHSGYLLDVVDVPVSSTGLGMTFRVSDQETPGGSEVIVWSAACAPAVRAGYYTVSLGGGCGPSLTTAHLPHGAARWLEVQIGAVVLSPRLAILATPHAALAARSLDTEALTTTLATVVPNGVNTGTNPVDWTKLKGVPPTLADGVDADTTYAAGGGLALTGTTFSIATGGVTNAMLQANAITVSPGTGLTGGGSAPLGGSTSLALANVPTITPGSYTLATITVDAQGRLTAASSGSANAGTVTSVSTSGGLTGGPITSSGTISIAANGVTNTQLASDAASLARVSGGFVSTTGSGFTFPGRNASLAFDGSNNLSITNNSLTAITIGTNGNTAIGSATASGDRLLVRSDSTTPYNLNSAIYNPALRLKNGAADTDQGVVGLLFESSASSAGEETGILAIRDKTTYPGIGSHLAFIGRNPTSRFEWMRLTSNGNVGIGTTSTAFGRLSIGGDVTNSDGIFVAGSTAISGSTTSYAKAGHFQLITNTIPAGTTESGYRMGITGDAYSSGTAHAGRLANSTGVWARAGIHGATPGATITQAFGLFAEVLNNQAGTTIDNGYGVYIENSAAVGTMTNRYDLYAASANAKSYFAGRVGIKTTTPGFDLDVAGTTANVTGSWTVRSDERLKTDVRALEGALDTVQALRGVSFHWKDAAMDAKYGRQRGFIAQEVERVVPEWVSTGDDGYKHLEKTGVEALLVEAIKELRAKSEAAAASDAKRLAAAEARLRELELRNLALERRLAGVKKGGARRE